MSETLRISLSPHIHDGGTVKRIMWGVVVALLPTMLTGMWFFGTRVLSVTAFSVMACVAIEYTISRYMLKKPVSVNDGSAVITGMLLAFNVPSNIPYWQLFMGALMAIGISKMAYGGLGSNPFNPALIGRAFMLASFPVEMTSWPKPVHGPFSQLTDGLTGATPLGMLAEEGAGKIPSVLDLVVGNVGGCIGEVSAIAIVLGGLFMIQRKIITWHIPVFYLLSLFVFTGILNLVNPGTYAPPIFHVFAGGAMLTAWFMATDMATSPMSVKGQIIFAIGGGLLTGLIRVWGSYPEGCSYSILIMNAFVPLIDRYFKPRRYGEVSSGGK